MAERTKPIIIKTANKEYTLDFSRRTVIESQRRGFDAMALSDPKTMLVAIDDFFFYAFMKNHPDVTREEVDALVDEIGGISSEIIERLSDLYADAVKSLYSDTKDHEKSKNATATVIL